MAPFDFEWQLKISYIMSHTNNCGTAAQTENKNQVNNRSSRSRKGTQGQSLVPANDAAVPVKVEDLEARLKEGKETLSKAKKQNTKSNEALSVAKQYVENQLYVVATQRIANGTASAEDVQIVASRKAEDNAQNGLAKFFAKEYKDSDEVAKAWESLGEEDSLTSAIAETIRRWNSGFCTLYKSIGITSKKQITPALLKGLCPFLLVATADGLKAAAPGRRAVRKNGKAVKKGGKKVYKYTLRAIKGWTDKKLFKLLEANYRMTTDAIFTEDDLSERKAILEAEVSALKALKAAKDALKKASENPTDLASLEKAESAEKQMGTLVDAAKAAGQLAQTNLSEVSTESLKPTRKGRNKKIA